MIPWKTTSLLVLLILAAAAPCDADDGGADPLRIVTDFTYKKGPDETMETARALALFGAKIKAVKLAATRLNRQGKLEHYEERQDEIFCLAANEMATTIIEETFQKGMGSCYVRIQANVSIFDFIRAQNKNLEYDKQESAFDYRQEMDQPVLPVVNPAQELARAYRYIRREQWRIAIIYLDHLEKKYPCWCDVYRSKAIAFFGMDDINRAAAFLDTACRLGSKDACRGLSSLTAEPH